MVRLGRTRKSAHLQATQVDYIRYANSGNSGVSISPPVHESGGYFNTKFGSVGYDESFYWTSGIARTGVNLLFTGTISPVSTAPLSWAIGGASGDQGSAMTAPFTCDVTGSVQTTVDMVELVSFGKIGTASQYVSVWVWRGGRILMFNGSSYTETPNPVVSSSEFVLGIHLPSSGPPRMFLNGALVTTTNWRTIAGNTETGANGIDGKTLLLRDGPGLDPATSPAIIFDNNGVSIRSGGNVINVSTTGITGVGGGGNADSASVAVITGPKNTIYRFQVNDREELEVVKFKDDQQVKTVMQLF
eukprot:jgi/Mesvir1/3150/Mv16315-RA.1